MKQYVMNETITECKVSKAVNFESLAYKTVFRNLNEAITVNSFITPNMETAL